MGLPPPWGRSGKEWFYFGRAKVKKTHLKQRLKEGWKKRIRFAKPTSKGLHSSAFRNWRGKGKWFPPGRM